MIGGFESLAQGFASFFSIWQACVAQISPFFMAYIVGLYFMGYAPGASIPRRLAVRTVIPSLVFMAGFSAPYALMTASGLPISRFLAYNSGTFSFMAGVVILLISLFIILHGRSAIVNKLDVPLHTASMSLLIGITFALVYSPCITPTLSKIMGIASRPETAVKGAVLGLHYALGLSLAFLVVGVALTALFARLGALARNPGRVKDVSAAILGILGVLNVTGYMTQYKAFILGFLVR